MALVGMLFAGAFSLASSRSLSHCFYFLRLTTLSIRGLRFRLRHVLLVLRRSFGSLVILSGGRFFECTVTASLLHFRALRTLRSRDGTLRELAGSEERETLFVQGLELRVENLLRTANVAVKSSEKGTLQ